MFFLNLVLSLNAVSCLVFGSLFVFNHHEVSSVLGVEASLSWLLQLAGSVLLVFALHLISSVIRKKKIKWEIYYFSFGDLLWVLGSAAILLGTNFITLEQGRFYAWMTSVLVLSFALLQIFAVGRLRTES